jgi:transposase
MDRESLRLLLERGESVERIAKLFSRHPSTVAYWMKKYGLVAPNREKHAARGGIGRPTLEALVEQGLSIAQIAQAVGFSKATVRHWLQRYGLRTQTGSRAAKARQQGLLNVTLSCPRHGEADFILEGRGYYRCKLCRQERVAQRRRDIKALLVAEAGGACCLCGYDRFLGSLQFHHLDPRQKRLGLSANGLALSVATARAEAKKCVLVCANCHGELEGGVARLPGRVEERPEESSAA